jgi:hypothetical protein
MFTYFNSFKKLEFPKVKLNAFIRYNFENYDSVSFLNEDTNVYDGTFSNVGIISTTNNPPVDNTCITTTNYHVTLPLFSNSDNGFTCCFWIKTNKTPSATGFPRCIEYGSIFRVLITSNDNLILQNDSSSVGIFNSITDNVWRNFCLVFNSNSTVKIYLNGVLSATKNLPGYNILTNTSGYLGKPINTALENFTGSLDDFRIYNYTLSDTQVRAVYNNTNVFKEINN